jgi:hypothetical protein
MTGNLGVETAAGAALGTVPLLGVQHGDSCQGGHDDRRGSEITAPGQQPHSALCPQTAASQGLTFVLVPSGKATPPAGRSTHTHILYTHTHHTSQYHKHTTTHTSILHTPHTSPFNITHRQILHIHTTQNLPTTHLTTHPNTIHTPLMCKPHLHTHTTPHAHPTHLPTTGTRQSAPRAAPSWRLEETATAHIALFLLSSPQPGLGS